MDIPPFISIIIPSQNRQELLERAILSLFKQSYPKDKYEVIIIDDGSTDRTAELVKALQGNSPGKLKYFYQENKGPAAARNFGLRQASGEIVVFTDSDCIASPDWLKQITAGYGDRKVAGIGGTIKPLTAKSMISQYCAYLRMNEKPDYIENTDFIYLITGNASFRKDYLTLAGGFDERYTLAGGEDPDLCYRLQIRGYRLLYNPEAIVFNPHKQSLKELGSTYFNYGVGATFLSLRRLSQWDLTGPCRPAWFWLFLKALGKVSVMFLSRFSAIIINTPLKALSYYSKEGLSLGRSISYAFLDFVRIFSFLQGCCYGYIAGKFKGFNIYNDLDEHNKKYSQE